MSGEVHCTKCTVKKGYPGVEFDDGGVCSLCTGDSMGEYLEKYESVVKDYERFISAQPTPNGDYDCMLMLSGGKDSMYMLRKLKTETNKRVVAYTYDHPYESRHAISNIKEIIRLMEVEHVTFSAHSKYKEMMRKVFLLAGTRPQAFKAEKLPCRICSSYLLLTGCIMAIHLNVPYILYCADPVQMLGVETDLKKMVEFLQSCLGSDFLEHILGKKVREIMAKDKKELPTLIFPYVPMMNSYNREEIIREMKKLGNLQPSSMGTMCSLYPLLEYYSYKNYDCCIDTIELAISVRRGLLPREAVISMTEEYKKIIMETAIKEHLTDADRAVIRGFTRKVHPDSDEEAEFLFNQIVSLNSVAKELGVLDDFLAEGTGQAQREEEEFLRSISNIGEDF